MINKYLKMKFENKENKTYECSFCSDLDCAYNGYGVCFEILTILLDGISEPYTCSLAQVNFNRIDYMYNYDNFKC